ncbi:MAG: hypothetical protein H7Y09_02150 [Chitinophagaceae bacterium]|nr:hypothetical protein [Anaerolineae bacterium]
MTEKTNDALRDLSYSTLAFYERFGVHPTLDGATNVFREEVNELIEAAHEGTNKEHIAEEAADVIVTVIGLCKAAGVDTEQLIEQMYAVIAKNDAKTHQTHVYSEGKIRRRNSQQ